MSQITPAIIPAITSTITPAITPATVRQVAVLARLQLPEERIERLSTQLESIIDYVAQIQKADVTGIQPLAHPLPLHNVFREDVVEPSMPVSDVLRNAPEVDGPFFKVPKVLGGDEDSAG